MTAHLRPCPGCSRHVRVSEGTCPFCGVLLEPAFRAAPAPIGPSRRLSRAALLAFGTGTLVLTPAVAIDCGMTTAVPFYGSAPSRRRRGPTGVRRRHGGPLRPLSNGQRGPRAGRGKHRLGRCLRGRRARGRERRRCVGWDGRCGRCGRMRWARSSKPPPAVRLGITEFTSTLPDHPLSARGSSRPPPPRLGRLRPPAASTGETRRRAEVGAQAGKFYWPSHGLNRYRHVARLSEFSWFTTPRDGRKRWKLIRNQVYP